MTPDATLLAKPVANAREVHAALGSLSVNVKTARQLGLEIPSDVLAAARQVYQ